MLNRSKISGIVRKVRTFNMDKDTWICPKMLIKTTENIMLWGSLPRKIAFDPTDCWIKLTARIQIDPKSEYGFYWQPIDFMIYAYPNEAYDLYPTIISERIHKS
jgi:hypothetical protein